MGLKRYILFSLLYIIAICAFLFFTAPNTYLLDLNISKIPPITLPVYAWAGIILGVLFLSSLAHLMFYGIKNVLHQKDSKDDIEKLKKHIGAKVFNENINKNVKNKELAKIINFIQDLDFNFKKDNNYNYNLETIDKNIDIVKNINDGQYFEKISKNIPIKEDNPLFLQNLFNQFKSNDKFYIDVIRHKDRYDKELVNVANLKAIEDNNFYLLDKEIKNNNFAFNAQMITKLFLAYEDDKNTLEDGDYHTIIQKSNFSTEDFINLVKNIHNKINPDKLLALMDDIRNKDELALFGYIYLLLEYELMTEAKEIIEEIDGNNEYCVKFNMYIMLKENNLKCDISDLI